MNLINLNQNMIFLLISKVQLVSRLPPFANRSVLTDPPSVAAPASVRCAVKKTATLIVNWRNKTGLSPISLNQSVRSVPNKIHQGHILGAPKKGTHIIHKKGHTSLFFFTKKRTYLIIFLLSSKRGTYLFF